MTHKMQKWVTALLAGLTVVGCGRAIEHGEPIRHEVRKPLAAPASQEAKSPPEEGPPVEILFPDIPEVPENIEGPSRPFEDG